MDDIINVNHVKSYDNLVDPLNQDFDKRKSLECQREWDKVHTNMNYI